MYFILRQQLIIIDEMGYLPFDDFGAHCFFQLVSRRYERASIIFTSNKSYGEWGDIFKDHVIAAAILDRILHHCTTVNIKGDSYRLKHWSSVKIDASRIGVIDLISTLFLDVGAGSMGVVFLKTPLLL